jgi:nitric oxide dioxygenase
MDNTKLTDTEIILIQSSFQKVWDKSKNFGEIFYDKLFKTKPDIVKLFKGDMKEQARYLTKMVKIVVDGLNNPQIIFPAVQHLGVQHYEFGVDKKDYKIFGACLIECIANQLGKEFTDKTKDAWQKLYDELAELMCGNQYK